MKPRAAHPKDGPLPYIQEVPPRVATYSEAVQPSSRDDSEGGAVHFAEQNQLTVVGLGELQTSSRRDDSRALRLSSPDHAGDAKLEQQ